MGSPSHALVILWCLAWLFCGAWLCSPWPLERGKWGASSPGLSFWFREFGILAPVPCISHVLSTYCVPGRKAVRQPWSGIPGAAVPRRKGPNEHMPPGAPGHQLRCLRLKQKAAVVSIKQTSVGKPGVQAEPRANRCWSSPFRTSTY